MHKFSTHYRTHGVPVAAAIIKIAVIARTKVEEQCVARRANAKRRRAEVTAGANATEIATHTETCCWQKDRFAVRTSYFVTVNFIL